jgi:hypothetical protein
VIFVAQARRVFTERTGPPLSAQANRAARSPALPDCGGGFRPSRRLKLSVQAKRPQCGGGIWGRLRPSRRAMGKMVTGRWLGLRRSCIDLRGPRTPKMNRSVRFEIEIIVCRPWTDGLAVTLGRPLVRGWVAGCPVRVPRFKRIGPPRHAVNRAGAQGQRLNRTDSKLLQQRSGVLHHLERLVPRCVYDRFESDLELSRIAEMRSALK